MQSEVQQAPQQQVGQGLLKGPSMNSWTISNVALRPRARFSQVMCLEVVVSKFDGAPALSQRPL